MRNREQIRVASKRLCISNDIDSQYSLLKLFYPLLKNGLVEFTGNDQYQVSPPLMILYPKQRIVVGINLSSEQKLQMSNIDFQQDVWEVIRFNAGTLNIIGLSSKLNCAYQKFDASILAQFTRIKDGVNSFEVNHLIGCSMQFYDTLKHKWHSKSKEISICWTSNESLIFYLKLKDKYLKVPHNSINPDGRLLAESFQACVEREDIFSYNRTCKGAEDYMQVVEEMLDNKVF